MMTDRRKLVGNPLLVPVEPGQIIAVGKVQPELGGNRYPFVNGP